MSDIDDSDGPALHLLRSTAERLFDDERISEECYITEPDLEPELDFSEYQWRASEDE